MNETYQNKLQIQNSENNEENNNDDDKEITAEENSDKNDQNLIPNGIDFDLINNTKTTPVKTKKDLILSEENDLKDKKDSKFYL